MNYTWSKGCNLTAIHIQYRPGHEGYVSEFTAFMDNLLQQHPEYIDDQHRGWSIFWDHEVNFDELKRAEKDMVPIKPYHY
jgi:Protein of unknown function (DUF3460)